MNDKEMKKFIFESAVRNMELERRLNLALNYLKDQLNIAENSIKEEWGDRGISSLATPVSKLKYLIQQLEDPEGIK